MKIHNGDCRDVLKMLEADSLHACVTDPPYELGFMGKAWDATGVANDPATWIEVLRVLKPGAHLLAFGGTRTHHRMICAIEDAGFEIRDCLGWLYGSGFPKSRNQDGEWLGWGTALKPAWEPIVLARKPLIGTVADNLQEHRTGAINIEGCRVATGGEELKAGAGGLLSHQRDGKEYPNGREGEASADKRYKDKGGTNFAPKPGRRSNETEGRWPANILHDGSDEVLSVFPSEAGAAAPVTTRNGDKFRNSFGKFKGDIDEEGSTFHGDKGSAARFFYCAKVSKAEREVGLQNADKRLVGMSRAAAAAANGTSYDNGDGGYNRTREIANHHPTVKPVELMRYLIRLITPPGGTVLDPFTGSGSTLRAADIEGFNAVGIELNPEYATIARARVSGDAPLFAEVA